MSIFSSFFFLKNERLPFFANYMREKKNAQHLCIHNTSRVNTNERERERKKEEKKTNGGEGCVGSDREERRYLFHAYFAEIESNGS